MAWKEPIRDQLDVTNSPVLTEGQKKMVKHWTDLQETLNRGDFDTLDQFFHKDFRYGNPNRPDLGNYEEWKPRSEERREGKEGVRPLRSRWSPAHENKNK